MIHIIACCVLSVSIYDMMKIPRPVMRRRVESVDFNERQLDTAVGVLLLESGG